MAGITLILALMLQQGATQTAPETAMDVEVEQLASPPNVNQSLDVPPVIPSHNGDPAHISQLPPTLEAPIGESAGEEKLRPAPKDDQRKLISEVARVAEMIRERGQQPTPEVLAREIGPEALAEYLNIDPAMLDSYGTPPLEGQTTSGAVPPSPAK